MRAATKAGARQTPRPLVCPSLLSLLLERSHRPDRVEEHHASGFHLGVRIHDAERTPVDCDEYIAWLPAPLGRSETREGQPLRRFEA
jgi:hypothetical protein